MTENEIIIELTKKWVVDVVIGCNFCPFAAKEIKQGSVHFQVENSQIMQDCLLAFYNGCLLLDEDKSIETVLLIFPKSFQHFDEYLQLVYASEIILKERGYEGIYQVASFHPLYCFAGSHADGPENFTNKSPYPMLHLLREESIEQALLNFPHPESIPEKNILFTRKMGYEYMKNLREACLKS